MTSAVTKHRKQSLPVEVGGELGCDDSALALMAQHPGHQGIPHCRLAERPARREYICGVAHEECHPLLAFMIACRLLVLLKSLIPAVQCSQYRSCMR